MQHFTNDNGSMVSEAIDGLLISAGGTLTRFSPDSHARVVVRSGWDRSQVALIAGGGSGHEPAFAGFVGKGMLTAAVCGEVFASPSIDAVLAAIVAVTGDAGCLLILNNYTGDRLNFGLAAEKARARGLKVEVLAVAEDVAIADAPQPRGLAGALFVHKIAGYLADTGAPLEEVARAAHATAKRVFSLGVARDNCTVPGSPRHSRIPDGSVEIGLGIHNEPGIELANYGSVDLLVADMCARLDAAMQSDDRLVLLLNNLGAVSGIEMSVILSAIAKTPLAKRVDLLIGPAAMMTSLDMPGFSLSCLKLDGAEADMLRAASNAPGWSTAVEFTAPVLLAPPGINDSEAFIASDDTSVRALLTCAARVAIDMEEELNALDAKIGDGDTGSTFARAGRGILERLDTLPLADGTALCRALSEEKSRNMGGSSGVLLAIFFAAAAETYKKSSVWPEAWFAGLSAMQFHGGAKVGDRTMIDAIAPAIEVLKRGGSLHDAASAAEAGAQATAVMITARAGRASYVSTTALNGVPDPGAVAIARIIAALAADE